MGLKFVLAFHFTYVLNYVLKQKVKNQPDWFSKLKHIHTMEYNTSTNRQKQYKRMSQLCMYRYGKIPTIYCKYKKQSVLLCA